MTTLFLIAVFVVLFVLGLIHKRPQMPESQAVRPLGKELQPWSR